MIAPICLLMMAAAPFWQAKQPAEWSMDDVRALLTNSPWAVLADAGRDSPAPAVQIYLATAEPVIAAEDRLRASKKTDGVDPAWEEYREYLVANAGKYIVLAIKVLKPEAYLDNSETKLMETESYMRAGKKKVRVTGHFPPSATDPFVRLVFPRELSASDRSIKFDLYVPGVGSPYREVDFPKKDLEYHGQAAF